MSDFDPKITINLGDTLPFLWEKLLGFTGKDAATEGLRQWFDRLQQAAFTTAATIQCVGMHTPLPMGDIYRPTKLIWQTQVLALPELRRVPAAQSKRKDLVITKMDARSIVGASFDAEYVDNRQDITLPSRPVTAQEFLNIETNAIITAGPGWGKTTFLHFLFLVHLNSDAFVPVLIPLRRRGSIEDLEKLLVLLDTKALRKGKRILLLIDGYDEISSDSRKIVSAAVEAFDSRRAGRVYVACRQFYDVYDLKFPQIKVAEFDEEDQRHYASVFMTTYGSKVDSDEVLSELRERGLSDLLRHPLLLALVCIVKSSSLSIRSRNVLDLIERALESLTFRWDQWKGPDRQESSPLDGRARMHCLMRIAHSTETLRIDERTVMAAAREQLDRYKWDNLDEKKVMLEIAQFFGILIPTDAAQWQFVHRTLHDYLAALFIMENGGVVLSGTPRWTTRLAYAACRSSDATEAMLSTLLDGKHFGVFTEMLSNDAPFDHSRLADGLLHWYEIHPENHYFSRSKPRIFVKLDKQFIGVSSAKFLHFIAELYSQKRGQAQDTFLAYAIAELQTRKTRISDKTSQNMAQNFLRGESLHVYLNGGFVQVYEAQ